MDWMSQTLEKPREGGNALLAPGVGNYKITDAVAGPNEYNGRNEVTLRVSGEGGNGKTTIPLEPWDQNKIDVFLKMFNSGLGNIGIAVEGRQAREVLANLTKELPAVVGNIVELNVVHSDRKPKPDGSHLKEDGTPWTDQKVYINRLVAQGSPNDPAPAQQSAPVNELDAAFAAVQSAAADDDIPF